MNRVKITVGGTEYKIVSDEPAAYVMELARDVDKELREMMDGNPRLSMQMAAVLTAITNADRARKAEKAADNLRDQIKELLDENARLRSQADSLQLRF